MITVVRKATVATGRLGEAVAFAREIASLASRVSGTEVRAVSAIGGTVATLGWIFTHKDLATYEASLAKLMGSPEYVTAIKKAQGLLIDGSVSDQIWRDL